MAVVDSPPDVVNALISSGADVNARIKVSAVRILIPDYHQHLHGDNYLELPACYFHNQHMI